MAAKSRRSVCRTSISSQGDYLSAAKINSTGNLLLPRFLARANVRNPSQFSLQPNEPISRDERPLAVVGGGQTTGVRAWTQTSRRKINTTKARTSVVFRDFVELPDQFRRQTEFKGETL